VDAFVKNNMLQVILISLLFVWRLRIRPTAGKTIVEVIDSVLHGLFGIVRMIMRLAPLGALGGIAFTVGKYGFGSLRPSVGSWPRVYHQPASSSLVVLGVIAALSRPCPLLEILLIVSHKDEILITFAT